MQVPQFNILVETLKKKIINSGKFKEMTRIESKLLTFLYYLLFVTADMRLYSGGKPRPALNFIFESILLYMLEEKNKLKIIKVFN